MTDVRIGLIGCGRRLRGLARSLIQRESGLSVTALHDPDAEAISAAQRVVDPQAAVYSDYRELLAESQVDWIMIGSPNVLHREQAVAAMEAGKDVFCEKPLATTADDCVAIRNAQRRTGRTFFLGFALRYSPHYSRLKQLVDDGAIGSIVSMEFNETLAFNHGGYVHQDWRRLTRFAGTHVLEKCCHDIDIASWLTGSLPLRVASFGGLDFFTPSNAHHVDRIGPNPETDQSAYMALMPDRETDNPFFTEKDIVDNQVAILEYAHGVRSTFHTNCNAGQPERRNYLVGTEGTLRADKVNGRIELRRIGWDCPTVSYDVAATGGHGGADPKVITELARCMRGETSPRSGVEEGFTSALTCFAIDEAMRSGTVVDLGGWWEGVGIDAQLSMASMDSTERTPPGFTETITAG